MIQSIRLPNGIALPYCERGAQDGPPVIFLHGYSDSWRSFALALPHLPWTLRAFAITQRGHGDADKPAEGYRSIDFAADVASFIERLDLPPAVIVGHSMGGIVAQRLALHWPERVSGLVLAGTATALNRYVGISEFWEGMVSRLVEPIDPKFVTEFQRSSLARPLRQPFLDTTVWESLKMPARVWRDGMADLLSEDFSDEVSEIAAPTLILWGDQDVYCRRQHQETLNRSIAGSRLVVYRGVGHAPHWEEPQRFASDVAEFVDAVRQGNAKALTQSAAHSGSGVAVAG